MLCNADLRGYLSTATTGKAIDAPYLESFSFAEGMAKSVGCDLPDTPFALKKALGPRETAYLLDRETMKIRAKAPR